MGGDRSKNSDVMYALLASCCVFEKVLDRASKWKPQYFVTTFIADCARKAGFKGIIYSSSRKRYGNNLVLFNASEPAVVPEGRPKVYIYEPIAYHEYNSDDPTSVFNEFSRLRILMMLIMNILHCT